MSFLGCEESKTNNGKDNDIEVLVKKPVVIKAVEVNKDELILNQVEGIWYYNEEPYNGYALRFHANDTLGERIGFYNGKREGVARQWSPYGVLRVESHYRNNRLSGVYKSWWENGELSRESHYEKGLLNGLEKQWYSNGQLSKLRHIVDGKEEGIQKGWLENGKLYVNYEAKNGRIYGMRRANSCYKLEDEVVIKN